jgi:hypothetical protein
MPKPLTIDSNMSGKSSTRDVDGLIVELSERQHGVVARRQLLRAGIAHHLIDQRLLQGRLHAVHRGVYAIGNLILTLDGRRMAATLACGTGAVLSHRAAAALWDLLGYSYLEVTVGSTRRRSGIRVHTCAIPADEITFLRGIPLTGISRTLFDLASVLPPHQVERAANEAEVRGHADTVPLAELVARYPRRKGIRTIREILDRLQAGTTVTHSELEARFLALLRALDLPPPEVNSNLFGIERDFVWRDQRMVVELDGRTTHHTFAAFERDRARDRALAAAGWRTVRITWRQLHEEPESIAADLRGILGVALPTAPRVRRCEAP